MDAETDYAGYTRKMLKLAQVGVDLEVDVRFVDMLTPRQARILDIGCGIGSAVAGLRARGHQAFGIDPIPELFQAATALHEPHWFRQMDAGSLDKSDLIATGLPATFDALMATGNVPEFLTPLEIEQVFTFARERLSTIGSLVIGTTTHGKHGPNFLDQTARRSGMQLQQRFADWHLNPFVDGTPWSVSVYTLVGAREPFPAPDGKFILPEHNKD
ncbi:class I SAM-dependent methyltransferase [Glutamicibacter sp.]|uniref:class I SAM-dependent methyltransferase n=1 Tax=Glutamicibacter sp. TaxID=1931995 RepID=UPI0028BF434C|nr:class I SAM-dependent methyltransferase [Glutamicibacter sp.]